MDKIPFFIILYYKEKTMLNMLTKTKSFLLDIFFPKFCLNCKKEENYLCQDCQALLEISGFHQNFIDKNLDDLYFATDYKNPLIKQTIQRFKYDPFVREISAILSSLIIAHFKLMDNKPNFYPLAKSGESSNNFFLMPIPMHKKRLKWRGFNPSELLAKELAEFFKIPLILNCLIKTKETFPQTELSGNARRENIKGAFSIKNIELVKNKNILIIDDIYTTGSTMAECAKILKKAGAEKIIGIVAARG